MKERYEVVERDEPCFSCNCCMRVEDGEWVHYVAQEQYCMEKFDKKLKP